MAQGVRSRSRSPLGGLSASMKEHPRQWVLAWVTAGLGAIALVCCLDDSLHVPGAWIGAAGLVVGTVAQMLSVSLAQRWVTVLGWVASFIGLLVSMGNGGFS